MPRFPTRWEMGHFDEPINSNKIANNKPRSLGIRRSLLPFHQVDLPPHPLARVEKSVDPYIADYH